MSGQKELWTQCFQAINPDFLTDLEKTLLDAVPSPFLPT